MKIAVSVIAGMCLATLSGCSPSKKAGDACERDSQCEGLLVCYKQAQKDKIGKCMAAGQARALYEQKKEKKQGH